MLHAVWKWRGNQKFEGLSDWGCEKRMLMLMYSVDVGG